MVQKIVICTVLTSAVCQAEPYWVRYEAASGLYPDQGGWTREVSDPAPQRWIEDGSLFIDSRAVYGMNDIYSMYSDGAQDPGPGETFVARWRLKVDAIGVHGDPGVIVVSDDQYCMYVVYGHDRLWTYPFVGFVPFDPGLFHTYELRSADMREFQLFIDGTLAVEAPLVSSLAPSGVSWGDIGTDSSLAEWNWMEFGVVPEPTGLCCLLAAAASCARRGSRSVCSGRSMS